MKITVIGSTHPGFKLSKEEGLIFGGKAAGICYQKDTFDAIMDESIEVTKKRINRTLNSKHHSVYDHVTYNLLLEDTPKIIAMILNNEKQYTTSEKSARYTKMKISEREQVLYDKWLAIFKDEIKAYDPSMKDIDVEKLAQENARGLTSVFTFSVLEHTLSLRQINNIMYWFDQFINAPYENDFFEEIKKYMKEFNEKLSDLYVEELHDENKMRELSLFDKRSNHKEIFDEVYCTTYKATFAQLAQAQRHRTLSYSMKLLDENKFFTPIIIRDDEELSKMWQEDIKSVADLYPQSMLISVCERGTYENFALKCLERLCSHAQLEISLQTYDTLQKYLKSVKDSNPEVYDFMKKYDVTARCAVKGYKCDKPCKYAIKQLERLV